MNGLAGLVLASGAVGLWFQRQRTRERARAAVEGACAAAGVTLLDQAVELRGWRLQGERGQRRLRRVARFEFTTGADDRRAGEVLLERGRAVWVGLAFPEGVQWLDSRGRTPPGGH